MGGGTKRADMCRRMEMSYPVGSISRKPRDIIRNKRLFGDILQGEPKDDPNQRRKDFPIAPQNCRIPAFGGVLVKGLLTAIAGATNIRDCGR